ncbi:MAG: hypothetical protein K0R76_111 [Alphaproteobacteria bacterium]|jgi:hypothetical protein|nr:hypothetical protein [Alphaproteobacteria bacterium]
MVHLYKACINFLIFIFSISYACDSNEKIEETIFLPHSKQEFTSQQFISWVKEQNKILSSSGFNENHFLTISAKIYTVKKLSYVLKTVEFDFHNAQLFPQEYFDQILNEIAEDEDIKDKARLVISFLKLDFDPLSFQFLSLFNKVRDFWGFSNAISKFYKDRFWDKYQVFIVHPINDEEIKVKTKSIKTRFFQIMKDLHGEKLIDDICKQWKFPIVKILASIDPDALHEECKNVLSLPKDPIFQKKTSFTYNSKPYEIYCLPSHDPVNFLAGLITDCCMHLGHEGEIYSILASRLPNAAMLFIFKKGAPVANSFVTLLTTNPSGNRQRKAMVVNCIVFNREISCDAISCALRQHFSDEPYDVYYGLHYNYNIGGHITEPRYYTPNIGIKYPISEHFLEKSFVDLVRSHPPVFSIKDPVESQDPLCAIDFMDKKGIGLLNLQGFGGGFTL